MPLAFHAQAMNAALASECANEQGKFLDYANKLFAAQNDWGKTTGTQRFKTYAAQLKLNVKEFNFCLDSERYRGKIENDQKEAESFGISGTPAIFIGDQFRGGALSVEAMKAIIDAQLAK
jgi:protein-disulfide isomerase